MTRSGMELVFLLKPTLALDAYYVLFRARKTGMFKLRFS